MDRATSIKAEDFYRKVLKTFAENHSEGIRTLKDIQLVVVHHVYPNVSPLAKVMKEMFDVRVFIPKESSKIQNPDIAKRLMTEGIPVDMNVTRETFSKKKKALKFLDRVIAPEKPLLIMDHGGYFAPSMHEIAEKYNTNLRGFTEYTKNGIHGKERYATQVKHATHPVVSIAEIPEKKILDESIGIAIAEAADFLSWQVTSKNINNIGTVGIIGYGDLGSSFANRLRKKNVPNILVTELDFFRGSSACANGFTLTSMEELCKQSDFILSATGAAALKPQHYDLMKSGVYLGTVTSADDELNLPKLIRDGELRLTETSQYTDTYSRNGKEINLLLGGKALNHILNGPGDPTIFLTEVMWLMSAAKVGLDNTIQTGVVAELSTEDRRLANVFWQQTFFTDKNKVRVTEKSNGQMEHA